MEVANQDIRKMIKDKGIRQWQLANKLNIADTTLSRWLRVELPDDKKERIINALQEFSNEK